MPDNAPTPPTRCSDISPDDVILFLGNSVLRQKNRYPLNIIKVPGESIFSINKTKDGYFISLKVFSSDGRIVAEIENNEFLINHNNYLSIKQPTKHTLVVRDQQGKKVLDFYFINPKAMKILEFLLLLSLGKQYEQRGMRAQTVILTEPSVMPETPFVHSSAPSRYSCGSHRTARHPLGSENTRRFSGAASPCGCRALPGCCQTAR